jgi:hypothetical protein
MKITRRELGKVTLSALPVAGLLGIGDRVRAQRTTKPNSKFAGVQIGLNVPYNFGGREMNPDEVLERCVKLNVNALELRSQPVEFSGIAGRQRSKSAARRDAEMADRCLNGSGPRVSAEI